MTAGRFSKVPGRYRSGFTMLELMIVVAIMAVILLMAFPSIRSALKKEDFVQDMNNVLEACDFGRKEAIMHDATMEMRIFPQTGVIEVVPVPPDVVADIASSDAPANTPPPLLEPPPPAAPSRTWHLTGQTTIDNLDVNFAEYKDMEMARVRFFPNGTSFIFRMVIRSSTGESRKITLEEATALADVAPLL